MSNLVKIRVTSDTTTIPARVHNVGTPWEYTSREHIGHRFTIERVYDDGLTLAEYTNNEGEGLFYTSKNTWEVKQIAGTAQFSVDARTAGTAKRWFGNKFKNTIVKTGAKLEFDMDY